MSQYFYIKWFTEIQKENIDVVGGKGTNLGELTSMGVDVPPGFCVTAGAYDVFMEEAGLVDKVQELMKDLDVENVDDLQAVSGEVRNTIVNGEIYKPLEEEIIKAYEEFSKNTGIEDPEVAVRSSATTGDLPGASFAGQQDTYLHIHGNHELMNHVCKCWASLWTSRAIYYREKQGYDHFDVSLSVVVQKMVNSEKSGAMFTANPINGGTNEMMINASWGLGGAVVSSTVTPDECTAGKVGNTIVERHIAERNTMVVKKASGAGTEEISIAESLGPDFVDKECLAPKELIILTDQGQKIEQLYKEPQDIEWDID